MEKDKEIKIINSVQTVGVIVVVAICLFFLVANAYIIDSKNMEKNLLSFDYIAIIFLYLSVVCFYSFAKSKNTYHIVIGLGFTFVFICMVVLHFVNLL